MSAGRGLSTANHSPVVGGSLGIAAQLDAMVEAGFTAASLDVYALRRLEPHAAASVLRHLDRGLRITDIAALTASSDDTVWAADLSEMVGLARLLRPEVVCLRPEGVLDERFVDRCRHATGEFAAFGTRLAVEPTGTGRLSTIALARSVAEQVPGLRIVLDSWHFFVADGDWSQLAALTPDEIAYVQLADGVPLPPGSDVVEQTMHHRELPGDGAFDLARYVEVLRGLGFAGTYCLEVLSTVTRRLPLGEYAQRCSRALGALLTP